MGSMDSLKKDKFERAAKKLDKEADQGEVTWAAINNDPNWVDRLKNQIKEEPAGNEIKG